MSVWDTIGKANATQGGTPFAPGTRGICTVLALREKTSSEGKGEILILEAAIETSEKKSDKYLTNVSENKQADVLMQKPGTEVSSVYMLTQHKAAPGAAKAMLLAVVGEKESSLTPEAWQTIVELAKHDNGALLKGTKVGFDVYTKETKVRKTTIHPVKFTHIEQTDEEIEANAKRYTK